MSLLILFVDVGTPAVVTPPGGSGFRRILYTEEEQKHRRKRKTRPEELEIPEVRDLPALPELQHTVRNMPLAIPRLRPAAPPEDDEEEILFLLYVLVDLD